LIAGSTAELHKELAALTGKDAVIGRSSRVGDGRVVRNNNWQQPGWWPPRISGAGLTCTRDPDTIQRMFDES
jgi:hypothetical protein